MRIMPALASLTPLTCISKSGSALSTFASVPNRASSALATCMPMKPAQPVTRTAMVALSGLPLAATDAAIAEAGSLDVRGFVDVAEID